MTKQATKEQTILNKINARHVQRLREDEERGFNWGFVFTVLFGVGFWVVLYWAVT